MVGSNCVQPFSAWWASVACNCLIEASATTTDRVKDLTFPNTPKLNNDPTGSNASERENLEAPVMSMVEPDVANMHRTEALLKNNKADEEDDHRNENKYRAVAVCHDKEHRS